MKNITVILPVHKLDDLYHEMLSKAVESVEQFFDDVKLLIVAPKDVVENITSKGLSDKLDINIVTNSGDTGFCSQVNLGIESCDTEWFSILEIDDELTNNWLKPFLQYKEEYSDVEVFLPIVRGQVRDIENNIVQSNTVIEVIYNNNLNVPHQYRWTVLRTRYDKTDSVLRFKKRYGNFSSTAVKVWKSMIRAFIDYEYRNFRKK